VASPKKYLRSIALVSRYRVRVKVRVRVSVRVRVTLGLLPRFKVRVLGLAPARPMLGNTSLSGERNPAKASLYSGDFVTVVGLQANGKRAKFRKAV